MFLWNSVDILISTRFLAEPHQMGYNCINKTITQISKYNDFSPRDLSIFSRVLMLPSILSQETAALLNQ